MEQESDNREGLKGRLLKGKVWEHGLVNIAMLWRRHGCYTTFPALLSLARVDTGHREAWVRQLYNITPQVPFNELFFHLPTLVLHHCLRRLKIRESQSNHTFLAHVKVGD